MAVITRRYHEPLLKRLPVVVNNTYGILSYDTDNLYPQRVREVMNRSRTAKTSVNKLSSFIAGAGWEDQRLAQMVINKKGHTMNDLLLNFVSHQRAFNNAIVLHITYNLNYTIKEITPVKFDFTRFGIPDEDTGAISHYMYATNWERDPTKDLKKSLVIFEYPKYNPDPNVVAAEVAAYGGPSNYPGQILYWSIDEDEYPMCVLDPVLDDAQAQGEIAVFRVSSIQNGFAATTLVKWPGTFETEEERQATMRDLNGYKGAKGANSTIVVEYPPGAAGDDFKLVENIQMADTDKMYLNTNKDVRDAIRETFSQPAEIHGTLPESGMFNKANIEEAYTYYNAETGIHRMQVSSLFRKLFTHWWLPAEMSFNIIPKTYK